MIVLGSSALGSQRRRPIKVDEDVFHKSEWLESGTDPELSPTMFLVEQPPNVSLRAHFHAQNQFQLFVRGSGRIGSHALRPLTVHYAGAYTGYGPLVSGPEGIAYFTIRSVFESGAFFMPESRGKVIRGPKRQLTSDPAPPADDASLIALKDVQVHDLIPPQAEGIEARILRLPPGASITAADAKGSAGQYAVVSAGSLVYGGRELCLWESLFVSGDEAPVPLLAGDRGAEVVLLRLPVKAEQYRA
jgi:hypothetical protein